MTAGIKAEACTACEQPFSADRPRAKHSARHVDCQRAYWREWNRARPDRDRGRGKPQSPRNCTRCGGRFLTRDIEREICRDCDGTRQLQGATTQNQRECIARNAVCGPYCPVMIGVESITPAQCRVKDTPEVRKALES